VNGIISVGIVNDLFGWETGEGCYCFGNWELLPRGRAGESSAIVTVDVDILHVTFLDGEAVTTVNTHDRD